MLPSIRLFPADSGQNVFIKGIVHTASNPLTIIFWSGVFSAQVVQHGLKIGQFVFYGIGCVLSTLCFLSMVAVLGSMMKDFLPQIVIQIMNVAVGIVLIVFGIWLVLKKEYG